MKGLLGLVLLLEVAIAALMIALGEKGVTNFTVPLLGALAVFLVFISLVLVNHIPHQQPSLRMTERRKSWIKTIFFVTILVLLVAAFTVLGVSRVVELGSAAFFLVVTAGVLVLLCFFCGLIAYARAKLLSVHSSAAEPNLVGDNQLPVFYYLQTIHREVPLDPVPDDEYWAKTAGDKEVTDKEQCPICLCEMDKYETATGISACCKREIHVKCAQDYFNSIRHVRCVFCRKDVEESANVSLNTTCPVSPPLVEHSNV